MDLNVGHKTEYFSVKCLFSENEGTLGITGWFPLIIQIGGGVWHLDVVLSWPGYAQLPKGSSARWVIWYIRWVKYVARQYGPYLPF